MNKRPNPFPEMLHFDNAGMVNGRRTIIITRRFPAITSHGYFVVPVGFQCDGASIPKLATSIIGSPLDEYAEDAVVHDFLYSTWSNHLYFDRWEADNILKETMWNRCLPLWKIAAFHAAVRAGGWKFYKK